MENLDFKVTLDSNCTCGDYDENFIECFGCFDDSIIELRVLVSKVQADKGWTDETEVNVEYKGVSWRRVSGDFVMKFNAKDLVEVFSLNGDFKLVFTYANGELVLVRYSHDEPVGTGAITFKAR